MWFIMCSVVLADQRQHAAGCSQVKRPWWRCPAIRSHQSLLPGQSQGHSVGHTVSTSGQLKVNCDNAGLILTINIPNMPDLSKSNKESTRTQKEQTTQPVHATETSRQQSPMKINKQTVYNTHLTVLPVDRCLKNCELQMHHLVERPELWPVSV